jgi:hypothetical protein
MTRMATGLIRNLNQDVVSLTARMSETGGSGATFDAVKVVKESCRIVAKPSLYPDHLVDATYIAEYMPVMEQRLRVVGARLTSLLNGLFH